MKFEWDVIKDFILGYCINVFWKAIVLWGVISAVLYLVIAYVLDDYLPSRQWIKIGIAIFIGCIIYIQGYVFYKIGKRIIPGKRIEECLTKIAELREKGVNELLNYKTNINTEEDFNTYDEQFIKWHHSLLPELEKVSPSQASIFRVLGTVTYPVPSGGFPNILEAKIAHRKGIIQEYTKRLKEMVDKFSLENLSNRVRQ